jgi:glycerol-3-phosphate acyltransferase PlsY
VTPAVAVALTLGAGYVCGSLPWGLWLGRWLRGVDVRTMGSGNLGATNVYRSLGPTIGIATLALDMAKGALPVWLISRSAVGAAFTGGREWCAIAVGGAAIVGHMWTFLASFRGGKGVATAGGVVLALDPISLLLCLAVFVVTVAITRFISVGSIFAAILFPIVVALRSARGVHQPLFWLAIGVSLLVIWRHRENVARLRRGEERRFSLARGGRA